MTIDGYVVAWGDADHGGNLPTSIASLSAIKTVFSTKKAFAALPIDGSVVAWGDSDGGGNVAIPSVTKQKQNVLNIFSNYDAFVGSKGLCPISTFLNDTFCQDCPQGQFSIISRGTCSSCKAGTYQVSPGDN